MELIYHDESFKLKDIGFPLKDIHIIDNWLPVQLHHWVDKSIGNSNIWAKRNEVRGTSPTGLSHHQFWGGTLLSALERSPKYTYPNFAGDIADYHNSAPKLVARFLDKNVLVNLLAGLKDVTILILSGFTPLLIIFSIYNNNL